MPRTHKTRRRRRTRGQVALRSLLAAAVLTGTYTHSEDAEAKIPRVLREGTRPLFFNFGFGGTFHMRNTGDSFKLHQEFGGHFQGGAEGPALAIVTQEEFYNYGRYYNTAWGGVGLSAQAKFMWDIRVVRGLGFYISPFGTVGYHGVFGNCYNYYYYCNAGRRHGGITTVGVTGKLVVDDRWVFWLQFPSFEILFNRFGWGARFALITGAGISFG